MVKLGGQNYRWRIVVEIQVQEEISDLNRHLCFKLDEGRCQIAMKFTI